jgi:hypothetical protein
MFIGFGCVHHWGPSSPQLNSLGGLAKPGLMLKVLNMEPILIVESQALGR